MFASAARQPAEMAPAVRWVFVRPTSDLHKLAYPDQYSPLFSRHGQPAYTVTRGRDRQAATRSLSSSQGLRPTSPRLISKRRRQPYLLDKSTQRLCRCFWHRVPWGTHATAQIGVDNVHGITRFAFQVRSQLLGFVFAGIARSVARVFQATWRGFSTQC